jgi:hypothetical protein
MTQYRSLDGLPLAEVERLLDAGVVWTHVDRDRMWRVRRNGKTQTWKTKPGHFRIPIKMGLRNYGQIYHHNLMSWFTDAPEV